MLGEGGIVADLQRKEDLFESDPSFSLLFGRFIISKVANLAHTSVEHVMSRLVQRGLSVQDSCDCNRPLFSTTLI